MRNLQECQAEVFRRSEKRIREQKQRRSRFFALCVPMALCLALFLTFALPELMPERAENFGSNELSMGLLTEGQPESVTGAVIKVEVTGQKVTLTHTIPRDVQKICDYLERCKHIPPGNSGVDSGTGQKENAGNKGNTSDTPLYGTDDTDCMIALITNAGIASRYCLTGTVLQDLTTHQAYTLTQLQTEELKNLLGLE